VFGTWKNSLRYGNEYFKLIEKKAYFETYQRYIELLLNRPGTVVRLAVLSDDQDIALGWSAIDGAALHYIHVTHEYRNQGIARSLVPCKIDTITHLTRSGMSIWQSKLTHAVFNPF